MISNRLLKIVFVVLLLVTFGELAYVYYQFNIVGKNIQTKTDTPIVINIPTIAPSSQLPETNTSKNDVEIARLLLQDLKKNIDQYQNKILTKSQKIDIYEANIKRLEFTEGLKNTFKYDVLLALKYKPNEDFIIYLNKDDLNKTKVFMSENDKLLPYDFSLLKSGDNVKIELITNVLEYFDKNTEQITITKFNK